MIKKIFPFFLLLFCFYSMAQDVSPSLVLGVYPKTYSQTEEVWASISVENSAALAGAYKIGIRFNGTALSYIRSIAAQDGPFSVGPSVHASGDTVILAGFQGISDTAAAGPIVLGVLVFKTLTDSVKIDSSSFAWISDNVYDTDAKLLALQKKTATPVSMRPRQAPNTHFSNPFARIENGYLIFSVPSSEKLRMDLYSIAGKKVASFFNDVSITEGMHAVPLGRYLATGIYVLCIKTPHYMRTFRLGVAR
jgi:hypothetical protein